MLHREVEVCSANEKGLGLVAIALIHAGEVVWYEDDSEVNELYTKEELADLPPEKARLAYWDPNRGAFVIGVDDPSHYMNHSCDPNLGWQGAHAMIALRDILPGEEVTYDYATTDIEGINGQSEMHCLCGSPACRQIIRPDDLLKYPELQQKYKGVLPPVIAKWLEKQMV